MRRSVKFNQLKSLINQSYALAYKVKPSAVAEWEGLCRECADGAEPYRSSEICQEAKSRLGARIQHLKYKY